MEENYWEIEDGIHYFVDSSYNIRFKLDFENKSVIKQYRYCDEWEDDNHISFIEFPPTLEDTKSIVESEMEKDRTQEEEMMRESWDEILKSESERLTIRDSWKEELKDLIDIDELWDDMSMNESWDIEEIVEVESTEDKNPLYPNYEFGYIKDDKSYLFMKTDHELDYIDHYYVWQQTGYLGDDYSGWMLYPLKNGKYLKISYSC